MESPDLFLVKFRQLGKYLFAFGQKVNSHDAVITCAMLFTDQPAAFRPLDESYDSVVAFLQKFG